MAEVEDFFIAIESGQADSVRAFVAADPSLVNARNSTGISAVLEATYRGNNEIAKLLIDCGARLDLFEAAATGTQDRLEQLLQGDHQAVNSYSPDGWTPLHLAAFFGRPNIVRVLLSKGAELNVVSKSGEQVTPLHSALANPQNAAIAQILLDAGADPSAIQKQGYTPLHYAAYHGLESIVRSLLGQSIDKNVRDQDGKTPYNLALERGHTAIAALLKPG